MSRKRQFKYKIHEKIIIAENNIQKSPQYPTVLITSGHGYGNVGDEAQLHSVLLKYKNFTKVNDFILLSPNPYLSSLIHKGRSFEWSARVSIFNSNWSKNYSRLKRYNYKNILKILLYLIRFRVSAFFANYSIPILLLNTSEALVFNQIKRSDLVHISGGGFLTGTTRSRLIDHFLLMKLCQWLRIKYILTGHSISNLNFIDKLLLKNALINAEFITLRDGGYSENKLIEIGINKLKVSTTSDEALLVNHLDPLKKKVLNKMDKEYIVFQYHDWQISPSQEKLIFKRYKKISEYLKKLSIGVRIISMSPGDIDCSKRLSKELNLDKSHNIKYSLDYKNNMKVISLSKLVLTMKHHPIVFSQASNIPVIALSFHDYSFQKNAGALKNTGHEKNNITFNDFIKPDYLESKIINEIKLTKNYEMNYSQYIIKQIISEKDLYSKKIERILDYKK